MRSWNLRPKKKWKISITKPISTRILISNFVLQTFSFISAGCDVSIAPSSKHLVGACVEEEKLSKRAIHDVFWKGKNSQEFANQVFCHFSFISVYLFIFIECLPRIASLILMNCYQWGSCLPCETPENEAMNLAVISNFHHWRSHEGSNFGPRDLWP